MSGYKQYVFHDGNGNVRKEAKLIATFAYFGGWCTSTTASCNVMIYDITHWYENSNTTTRSSNNAFTNLTMGRRYLGITVEGPQYRIKLNCVINGNLSQIRKCRAVQPPCISVVRPVSARSIG